VWVQSLVQRQENEQELNQKLQKVSTEKNALAERVAVLQRAVSAVETEKKEIERSAVRLEKDKSALKKTLDKVRVVLLLTMSRSQLVSY
jgi:rootletin